MIWRIPKMWEGGECWIIGGGPSMPRQFGVPEEVIQNVLTGNQTPSAYSPFLSPIQGKHVIGINAAFLIGTWMDVIFFGDRGFYFNNRRELIAYPNIKVTCSGHLKAYSENDRLKFVPKDGNHPRGISSQPNRVSWNGNSGAAAISLAHHFGVKRILLLGFDMHCIDNKQHWHSVYHNGGSAKKPDPKRLPFERHKKGFEFIAKDAKRLGIEILNVSPDSTIKELKKVELKDIL